jgi:hypothetical protein
VIQLYRDDQVAKAKPESKEVPFHFNLLCDDGIYNTVNSMIREYSICDHRDAICGNMALAVFPFADSLTLL